MIRDIKRSLVMPNWLELILVAVFPAALYLRTLAPTLTWAHNGQDGGDLITAVYTLGVPHPPGYPTYVLLGRLFAWLPVGGVAYRLNLMSAVCAVLAITLVYLVVRDLLMGAESPAWIARISALGAAWALAVSPLFWSQAIIAEVYTLNAFFVALCLYWLLRWRAGSGLSRAQTRGGMRRLVGLSFAFGLAVGNHLTIALLVVPVLIYLAFHQGAGTEHSTLRARARRYGPLLLALGAGLSVYLYLPWAAWRDPPLNWGDPRTLWRFLWVVSGGPYRAYVFALPLAQVPARLSATAWLLLKQFGPWGVALGLTGLGRLWQDDKPFGLLTGASAALYWVYAVGYDTSDSYVYLIPAFLFFAVWIGTGTWTILVMLRERWVPLVGLAGVALLTIIVTAAWVNLSALDLSDDRSAYDWGVATLEGMPKGGLVVTKRDEETFTLWYLQYVEGVRPDVVVVDKDLLGYDWYGRALRARYPHLE
ncbi:MAG: DUF2723 domain-containing protein [Anaerolineae bacterium]